MSDETPAVLRVADTIYGAAAGNVFPNVEHAQQVADDNLALFAGQPVTVLPIQPHALAPVDGETHDSTGRTGIPGWYEATGAGSPDGTLRDPESRALLAVLTDGTSVYGAAPGSDHPAFGEIARAQELIDANQATHLTAVEIHPFDELL